MGSPHILVIEDNAINLELLVYALTAFGYEVQSATSASAALALARNEAPALILCDIQMPGMDGYQFGEALHADPVLTRVPLIGVSALAMVGDRDKALRAGFDDYLAKPVDFDVLQACLRRFGVLPTRVPRDQSGLDQDSATPPSRQHPQPKAELILIVDDVSMNLDIKKGLLEPMGYRVLTASYMDEALELALRERPALIMSDVGMHGGSGFDFIQRVKALPALKEIPFIFLTATHASCADQQRGLALGAQRFLLRPIEMQDLLSEIEYCLGRRSAP